MEREDDQSQKNVGENFVWSPLRNCYCSSSSGTLYPFPSLKGEDLLCFHFASSFQNCLAARLKADQSGAMSAWSSSSLLAFVSQTPHMQDATSPMVHPLICSRARSTALLARDTQPTALYATSYSRLALEAPRRDEIPLYACRLRRHESVLSTRLQPRQKLWSPPCVLPLPVVVM